MKFYIQHISLLAVSLLAAGQGRADFKASVVPADAQWVIYANLDSLRESAVGKQLITAVNKIQTGSNQMPLHLDIPKVLATVGTITAYGTNFSKDAKMVDGTLVIQGTPDLRKIAEAMLIESNLTYPNKVTEVKDLGYTAYALNLPKGKGDGAGLVIAFPPEGIVLVSKSEDQLRKALSVFKGEAPSLEGKSDSQIKPLLDNTVHASLFAASVVPSDKFFPENAPQARMLHMATSGSIALGDDGAKTFGHLLLVASSDEMADKLMKILQGMTAMMSLGETSDQQLNEFLNSATVNRQDTKVTLNLSYSSERLVQMIERMVQSTPENRAKLNAERSIGKVVGDWTIDPATDEGTSKDEWRKVDKLALSNGSVITFRAGQIDHSGAVSFDKVRIVRSDASDSASALTYTRRLMTEVHRPIVGTGPQRFYELLFPGDDGVYNLEIHLNPAIHGKTTLAVGVRNANPPSGDDKSAHERASDTDNAK